ncbi:MAG: class I SAM-dependent methyltransferase [Betaproteobacteria bacterium]
MHDPAPHGEESPSPWVMRFAPLVAGAAGVLDLACGTGRHSRFFAARGCSVVAVDRDPQALACLAATAGVVAVCADLERGAWPLSGQRFDAVVVTRYLHRPRITQLVDCVAADGVLLYETFAQGNEAYGKPSNPDFLLAPGELLDIVRGLLRVVAFEQGAETLVAARPAVVQRIAAVGNQRAWPVALP